ncbi:hypothetical protein RND71_021568 [Anisodus tanguticus]|uniref:Uncharacterized protein n=1 Tax=Anisodus tanguticus TaxID=243964 RepID=A0AAE1RVD8_9SOLA|nr:hypothetical protein RND71_021568 [Anisodus tanguticus]
MKTWSSPKMPQQCGSFRKGCSDPIDIIHDSFDKMRKYFLITLNTYTINERPLSWKADRIQGRLSKELEIEEEEDDIFTSGYPSSLSWKSD